MLACIHHPYFTRAWITQEILLARKIVVLHKNMQLRWALFSQRLQVVSRELERRHVEIKEPLMVELYRLRKTANWRKRPSAPYRLAHRFVFAGVLLTSELIQTSAGSPLGSGYYDFFDVLERRKQAQCMDTRDRIFSLNSLIEPGHDFIVDYHESSTDIFWKVCEHFNAWVDFTRVCSIADALSLSTFELLVSIETRLTDKLTMRLQEGQFHTPAASWLKDHSVGKARSLYCKKNVHGDIKRAARVERRQKNDLLLCPILYGNSPDRRVCIASFRAVKSVPRGSSVFDHFTIPRPTHTIGSSKYTLLLQKRVHQGG